MPIFTPTKEVDVVRAWKDESYFRELTEEEQASIPANPAGELDLQAELKLFTKTPTLCLTDTTPHCTCIVVNHTHPCTN